MRNPKFTLFKNEEDGLFDFDLRARNGQIILESEGHAAPEEALAAIHFVKESASSEEAFDRIDRVDGEYQFVLRGPGGAVVAKSEAYTRSR